MNYYRTSQLPNNLNIHNSTFIKKTVVNRIYIQNNIIINKLIPP